MTPQEILTGNTRGNGKTSLQLLYAMKHGLTGLKVPELEEKPEVDCIFCYELTPHKSGYCSKECKEAHKVRAMRKADVKAWANEVRNDWEAFGDACSNAFGAIQARHRKFVHPTRMYRKRHQINKQVKAAIAAGL